LALQDLSFNSPVLWSGSPVALNNWSESGSGVACYLSTKFPATINYRCVDYVYLTHSSLDL